MNRAVTLTKYGRRLDYFAYAFLIVWLTFNRHGKAQSQQIYMPVSGGINTTSVMENINKLRLYYMSKRLKVQQKLNETSANLAFSFPRKPFTVALTTATTTKTVETTTTTTTTTTTSSNFNTTPLRRRICYYANWAPYRELSPPLYPDQIDPALCTHIHFAFAKIDPKNFSILPTEEHDINWTARSNMPLYIRLYGLKRRNTNLKILLAIGGWSARSEGFNYATKTVENRTRFINETINFLREWNFDGVDLG
jgi:hypothetical protein